MRVAGGKIVQNVPDVGARHGAQTGGSVSLMSYSHRSASGAAATIRERGTAPDVSTATSNPAARRASSKAKLPGWNSGPAGKRDAAVLPKRAHRAEQDGEFPPLSSREPTARRRPSDRRRRRRRRHGRRHGQKSRCPVRPPSPRPGGANGDASPASDAGCGIRQQNGLRGLCFRIVTPDAGQRTALQEYRRAHTGTVAGGKALDTNNGQGNASPTFHHCIFCPSAR